MRDFEVRIGYSFQNPQLLIQAMTHRSYPHENSRPSVSNERLEFLGDSILGFVVTEYLYHKFPETSEGPLSTMRAMFVKRSILSRIAQELGVGEYILVGKGEKKAGIHHMKSILSDALEALIAGIYLDGGIESVRKCVVRWGQKYLTDMKTLAEESNYKSMFQEYTQEKYKCTPEYRLLSQKGPRHRSRFTIRVLIAGHVYGQGSGSTKKEAEQEAAKQALQHVQPTYGDAHTP